MDSKWRGVCDWKQLERCLIDWWCLSNRQQLDRCIWRSWLTNCRDVSNRQQLEGAGVIESSWKDVSFEQDCPIDWKQLEGTLFYTSCWYMLWKAIVLLVILKKAQQRPMFCFDFVKCHPLELVKVIQQEGVSLHDARLADHMKTVHHWFAFRLLLQAENA